MRQHGQISPNSSPSENPRPNYSAIDEEERIKDLLSYKILDTSPEQEFNDLVQIAATVFDTPVSLITLVDDKRQWFKSKIGLDINETPREYSFCQYALKQPDEILVVNDPLNDSRFKDNPFVIGEPYIRFYAGAPLCTPNGHVLGTLCVVDNKPKEITQRQKKALVLLAEKTMTMLEARKLLIKQNKHIAWSSAQLKNLTDQVPGVVFQLQMTPDHEMSFTFLSRGIKLFHSDLDPEAVKEDVHLVFDLIHTDDYAYVMRNIQESYKNGCYFCTEFRVLNKDGKYRWYSGKAQPEKQEDGTVVWYGIFQNITNRKEYEETLEQISFDISHVIRRPISSLLGLTALIENDDICIEQLKEYSQYIRTAANELDQFTRKLFTTYHKRRAKVRGK